MARYAEEKLYSLLTGNSDITDAIDLYGVLPAVFNDTVRPNDFTGNKYIMMYGLDVINITLPVVDQPLVVSVRTPSRALSVDIVSDIIDTIHRYNKDGFNFVCTPLAVIRPQDETDLYNAPINVRALSK